MTLGDLAEFLAEKRLTLRVTCEGGTWVATLYSGRTPAGVGAASGPEEAVVRARVDFHDLKKASDRIDGKHHVDCQCRACGGLP